MKTRPEGATPSLILVIALALGLLAGFLGIHSPVTSNAVETYLLPIFFLGIGVELRHELSLGHLSRPKLVLVPTFAAIAGVVVPAILFCATTGSFTLAASIPTATDLTLGLAVLMLVRSAATSRIRAKFLALATVDDVIGLIFVGLAIRGSVPTTLIACLLGLLIPGIKRFARPIEWLSDFLVVPVFGLVAAMELTGTSPSGLNTLVLAAVLLRPVGKFLGIGVVGAIFERRLGSPQHARDWAFIGILGGIGFTVSVLLAQVIYARDSGALSASVLATLLATAVSTLAYLFFATRSARRGHLSAK